MRHRRHLAYACTGAGDQELRGVVCKSFCVLVRIIDIDFERGRDILP